ncbi:hypothetical protein DRO27_00080 [Candidatus Bathyarchaeota archaeon]|nr:MAG: hypothetical protein DRO27_00080 [Candidatus Bathyarchaeota archaeon]
MKIAFAGEMTSGKTTAAEYLSEVYGFGILSFADKLKYNLIDIGVPIKVLFEEKTEASRTLMQVYGEVMRDYDPEYWVDYILEGVSTGEGMLTEAHAVDDMRYLNEGEVLKEEGFHLVCITKKGPAPMWSPTHEHASENEWRDIDFDYHISAQEGDLVDLFGQLDDMIADIIKNGD